MTAEARRTAVDPATVAAGTAPTRLIALDGVRGVAALIVVFYHVSLLAKTFARGGGAGQQLWTAVTESPLKVLFAGTESVLVFFVLSGLVVALPLLRRSISWPAFLMSRLVRLYLPIWGALLFATALIVFIPRSLSAVTAKAWVVRANATEVTPDDFLSEASLLATNYDIVNTLWSLRWELAFTALLPLAILIAVVAKRHVWVVGIIASAATVAGRILGIDALVYLPVFLLGTLIAVRLEDLVSWTHRRPRPVLWAAITVVSVLLLVANWWTRPFVHQGTTMADATWGVSGIGALGLVLVAVCSPGAERLLSMRVPQWLGKVSFSLYLVHVPIIATLAFLVGDARWWLVGLLAVPLSLVVSTLFFRFVERPSHLLARRVGRLTDAAVLRMRGRGRPA
jgi:peptidoglycan/LPS O-acetylase OafA/YrhL